MTKKEKGQSHSIRPVSKRPPQWCKYEPEEVEALVVKLAKDGNSSSRIGTILRDQHGIPLTKTITGKSVTDILKEANMAPSIPEDLNMLLRKASVLHTHLERNRKDLANKRSLQLTEANIYKLSKYYKRKGVLPANWRYSRQTVIVT